MILLLALGNGSRGDDGVGLALGRALVTRLPPGSHQVVEAVQLLPEHAELTARADAVVFLDAAVSGAPGEVHANQVTSRAPRAALLHALTPEEILGLARTTYGQAPAGAAGHGGRQGLLLRGAALAGGRGGAAGGRGDGALLAGPLPGAVAGTHLRRTRFRSPFGGRGAA